MSASNALPIEGKNRYPRSAHAPIRGYLYQTCLGVLRWLDLQPNEILLCEGDEDLDRFLLGGGSVSEQVKAYSGKLGLSDQAVIDSLRSFLQGYVTLGGQGKDRYFIFTTTAQPSRERKSGLDFDLLEAWRNGDRTPKVLKAVRSLLITKGKKDKKDKQDKIKESVAWLDGQSDGWKGFLDSVEWSFDAPDLDATRQTIRNRLAAREDTRLLPAEIFLERLVVRVLDASIQKDPKKRMLTRKDFSDLLVAARTDLGDWVAGSEAKQIRKIFSEIDLLDDLLDEGTRELPEKPSRGQILTAAREVFPFDEERRKGELAFLESWCSNSDRRSVLLFTGEGGSGKTRLLLEWCRRMRHQSWHAGFLKRNREKDQVLPLLKGIAPRLVVIDYAETRVEIVEALLVEMGQTPKEKGPKLRVVLLARWAGDWWGNLARKGRDVRDLLKGSPPLGITPLIPEDIKERRQVFRIAVETFAWQLRRSVPADLKEPGLSEQDFDRALYLHMAALAALDGKQIETAEDALKETLDHERQFWDQTVEDEVSERSLAKVLQDAMVQAVAALTLTEGAANQQQATALLNRVLPPFHLPPYHSGTLLRLLRGLYGTDDHGGRYLEPLQPDLLGEQLVAETLAQNGDLLGRVLDGGSDTEASSTLTVLTRLAQREPSFGGWLRTAFQGRLDRLAELALDVAVGTGDPVGLILAKELEQKVEPKVVAKLQKRCDDSRYRDSVPLREVARVVTGKALVALKNRKDRSTENQQIELARQLLRYGSRLSAIGDREEALDSTQEALEIFRQLARSRPDEFLPEIAKCLNNLGTMFSALGRRKEAFDAIHEAGAIFQQLAQRRPGAFLPDLSSSLNNLGAILGDLGRHEEALNAVRDAVEIKRQLAQTRPYTFLPDLAMSLGNLGARFSALGRPEDALRATQEAVEIRRRLVHTRPDVFLPDLALSLSNLGAMLNALGRPEDALHSTQEATEIRRQLAQTRPNVFLHDLATSLNNLGNMFSALGRREEALEVSREAVEIGRLLVQSQPDVFLPHLASSLTSLGKNLGELGYLKESLVNIRESVLIRRKLGQSMRDAFLPELAKSLNNLGKILSDLGQHEEALDAAREAVEIRREFAKSQPDAFLPNLARSLNNLGMILNELGRDEEALRVHEEAVEIRRQLAQLRPDAFLHDLAISLNNLGAVFSKLGRYEDALGVTREAIEMRRQLVRRHPDAFLPDLAMSLYNLGIMLRDFGHPAEWFLAEEEAVQILAPFFLRLPIAFASLMIPMVRNYLESAKKAGKEPDTALLAPIAEAYKALSASNKNPDD